MGLKMVVVRGGRIEAYRKMHGRGWAHRKCEVPFPSPVEENSLEGVFPFPMGKLVESHRLWSGGWMLV